MSGTAPNLVPQWSIRTRNAGTETFTNLDTVAFAPIVSTWYWLKIVVNADATEVRYYVRTDATDFSLWSTITTNIPKLRDIRLGVHCIKIAGVISHNVKLDDVYYKYY